MDARDKVGVEGEGYSPAELAEVLERSQAHAFAMTRTGSQPGSALVRESPSFIFPRSRTGGPVAQSPLRCSFELQNSQVSRRGRGEESTLRRI